MKTSEREIAQFKKSVKPVLFLLAAVFMWLPVQAARELRVDDVLRDGFVYRNLAPFRAGGWVSDITTTFNP